MLYHDLLCHVFEVLDGHPGEYLKPKKKPASITWASAALVCRQWAIPAQAILYRKVYITIVSNPSRNTRAILFARTMHGTPHLRALLRHFSLTVSGVATLQTELVDWMLHVPPGSLLSLESSLEHREQPAQRVFYQSPAILHVRSLTLRGHHPPELLRALGSFHSLEKLRVQFDDFVKKVDTWTGVDVAARLTLPPLVRLVHIDACTDRYLTPFLDLMRHVVAAPHVQTIKLRLVSVVAHTGGAALAQILLSVTPNLRELFLWGVDWVPAIPFLDDLVLRTPALERLESVLGTFTDALFSRLPATLRCLTLTLWNAEFFPHEAGLMHLLERKRRGEVALNEIEFYVSVPEVKNQLAGLAAACDECGVAFRWTG